MKKAVIFDLDGTLWNSAKEVITSWNEMIETFEDKDHFVTLEEMYGLMGKPMDEIGDLVFPNVSKERRLELMRICTKYENEYLRKQGGTLFPKVEETLKELSKEYSLYIVSNCQVGYIEAFLGYYGFEHYFEDTECYGNTGKMKGHNIKLLHERNELDFAVYVGDTLGDYNSTMEAGLPFILAGYGFGNVPQAEYVADSFEGLVEVVKQVEKKYLCKC